MWSLIQRLKTIVKRGGKGATEMTNGTGEETIETQDETIPEAELAETIGWFKEDLRQQREDLSDKIMHAYMTGRPIHDIRPLEQKLRQFEADIASFKQ